MARKRSDDLDAMAHNARLSFVKHELHHGLDLARTAVAELSSGNRAKYEDCKARAMKTHKDFRDYLAGISASLTATEEEELEADLLALGEALNALD
jgi:hypothetical protein